MKKSTKAQTKPTSNLRILGTDSLAHVLGGAGNAGNGVQVAAGNAGNGDKAA